MKKKQMENEYKSDYKVLPNERQEQEAKIEMLTTTRNNLIAIFGEEDEDAYEVIHQLQWRIEYATKSYEERYPDGIYKLDRDVPGYKAGTLFKRVISENETCEKCIFGKMPCLNINTKYGCYKRAGKHVVTANGVLINEGHFELTDY